MNSQEQKLKILITTDLYTVSTNGVVTSVQNLFQAMTEKGHEVRILTISDTMHSHKDGPVYYIRSIPLTPELFANDSHCMTGLQSNTLGIYEKDSGRGVVCSIRNFPYCLIWSKPGEPKFVCIEPWNSLPSRESDGYELMKKPAAAILQPGESWSTTLSTAFVR